MDRRVKARAEVERIARTNPVQAVCLARQIDDPWYRCQSLANAARYLVSEKERDAVLSEAFRAAEKAGDANRVVTVSAWPLEVLNETGGLKRLECDVDRLLEIIKKEPHPTGRGDALFVIFMKIQSTRESILLKLVKAFSEACMEGHGWRRDRNLRDMALIMAKRKSTGIAFDLINLIEEKRVQRQAIKKIAGIETIDRD